ncbi:MAG: hypothetical protein U1D06_09440 [Paracoccaceae bacterium]|nr:hypothetical protein [Paracoccaceae bacterium]
MTNPFKNRSIALNGPVTDIVPVSPSDTADLSDVAVALYVETGGFISLVTVSGASRTVKVADHAMLPLGVTKVAATGTTATGIHAMVFA